jgi:predicted permease
MPLASEPQLQPAARLREAKPLHWLYIIGRLKPATAIPPVEAQLSSALRQWLGTIDLSRERGEISQQHVKVISAAAGVNNMRNAVAPTLRMLQLLAAAVLLIACANLASLLLARGTARRTETAVRVALGASRTRLVGQFLLESVLLACAGGLAGLIVAFAGARAIVNLAFRGATDVPVDPSPSWLVIAFALGASLATGALFGAAPAIVGSRTDPIDALRGASRTTGDRSGRLRGTLISLQVALSLVLITCAGLLGRSLQNLESQNFGVAIDSRSVVGLAPSLTMVAPEELPSIYARMQERLVRIPGVVNAAFSLYAPMSGDNWSTRIAVEGLDPAERAFASWNRVSPRYFDTVGTPLLRGRAFSERDRADSPLVAVVTQSFARKFFGDADPIGRRIGQTIPEIEIVGVVGDAKYQDGRRAPREMFFLPYLQETSESRARAAAAGIKIDRSHYPQAIEIHTSGAVPGLEREIRQALADVDRRVTVRSILSMDEQVARAFNMERLIARLTVAFGGVALLLACVGLYGVTAYSVARRTREIGLRMAVGASWPRVMGTILRSALGQVVAGHRPSCRVDRRTVPAGAPVRRHRARPARALRRLDAAGAVRRNSRAAARRTRCEDGSRQSTSDRVTGHRFMLTALTALLVGVPLSLQIGATKTANSMQPDVDRLVRSAESGAGPTIPLIATPKTDRLGPCRDSAGKARNQTIFFRCRETPSMSLSRWPIAIAMATQSCKTSLNERTDGSA